MLSSLPCNHNSPLAKCGCKKNHGLSRRPHKHVHSSLRFNQGARLDGVSTLGPLFRTASHAVRTQHGVTASAGQRRGAWRLPL
jgi:hypothetical protein